MKRLRVALMLAVGLALVGAVAQVTRQEFDGLVDQVDVLHAEVVLLKIHVLQLKDQIGEAEIEAAPLPPTVPERSAERTVPRPAATVRNASGKPLWINSAHCRYQVHCDYCLANEAWRQSIAANLGYEMPPAGTCPYGMTLAVAKRKRLDLIGKRIADGLVTPEHGYEVAVKLGLIQDGDPVPWDDESRLEVGDDRRHRVAVTCGGACGGLCFGCPILG